MADQALARARLAAQEAEIGGKLTRATVVTWNASDGYVISLGGAKVTQFTILESMSPPNPGDVVAVFRFKSNILLLGTIEAASAQDVATFPGTTVTAASLTNLAVDSIPLGAVQGAVYELEAWGNGVQAATTRQALTFGVALAGNNMSSVSFGTTSFGAAGNAFRWHAIVRAVCQGAGINGTWTSFIKAEVNDFNTNLAPGNNNTASGTSSENTGTTSVDTTISENLALRAAWNATTGAPTLTTQVQLPLKRIA
jgi:hypothetical protein